MIEQVMKPAPVKDGPKGFDTPSGKSSGVDMVFAPKAMSREPVSAVPVGNGRQPDMVFAPKSIPMTPAKAQPGKMSERAVKQSE